MPEDVLTAEPEAPASETATTSEPAATPAAPEATTGEQPAAAEPEAAPEPIELDYPDEDDEPEPETPAAEAAAAEPEAVQPPEPTAASQRFGTAALSRALKENPELAKVAETNPRLRAQLYQMARRSQELADYQDVLPSLSQAKEGAAALETLGGLDRAYFGQDSEQFWRGLHEASQVPDPATGQPRSSGAYERHVQFLQRTFLDGLEDRASQSGSEDIQQAVKSIREALGWGTNSRTTPNSRAADGRFAARPQQATDDLNLPPHIRQQLQELEQLRSRRSAEESQAQEHFLDETANEAGREIRAFVDGILANARMSDYDKQNIARDFLEEVQRVGDADKVHNAALNEIIRTQGMTPAARAALVARSKAWVRQNGRDILDPILKRAGAALRQRQDARQQTAANARREPRAAGTPAPPAQPNARDLIRAAEGKLGRRLSDREILDLG